MKLPSKNKKLRPAAVVVARERSARAREADSVCTLGDNVKVDPTRLGQYCSGELDARADDLVVLAGVVAFADRSVVRATAKTWVRELHVRIPVLDVAFWSQPDLVAKLREMLNLLTGDDWRPSFSHRRSPLAYEPQKNLDLLSGAQPVVIPYSDGMDSFVVARLHNIEHPATPLIMVTTGHRKDADASAEKDDRNSRYRFAVPFQVIPGEGRFRESSFRSRALIYATMGAVAAKMARARSIIVAESGQGALGPWLAPVGNEADDLRMHPLLTSKMGRFLSRVLDTSISFQHPRLWSTKAQTLKDLVANGGAEGVQGTRSCARDARHASHLQVLRQCGVCAGCLLRRVSMFESQIEEPYGTYMWTDLTAPTLDASALPGLKAASKNDIDQAAWGVCVMQQLAAVPKDALAGKAWALARAIGSSAADVEVRLRALIAQHADEWHRFVKALGPRSFLRQWMP